MHSVLNPALIFGEISEAIFLVKRPNPKSTFNTRFNSAFASTDISLNILLLSSVRFSLKPILFLMPNLAPKLFVKPVDMDPSTDPS